MCLGTFIRHAREPARILAFKHCLSGADARSRVTTALLALIPIAEGSAFSLDDAGSHDAMQIGIASLVVLQTALIVMLMLQNHRRRRMQDDSKRQQSEMTHAARLMLVGEMTASITHEVSQPLSAILSNADAAEMLLNADPLPREEIRHILDDIRRDDLRAHEIVRNLRNLLAKRELRAESVDLNAVARTALMLTKSDAARRHVMVRTTFDESLPRVLGDPVHLQQVFLNLVVNAMDSMAEVPADERQLHVLTRLHDARSVEVVVMDTGAGVKPDQLPKLFDSFYTTKSHGMGLGLSIARAIVQTHGGTISVHSDGARGAAFRFTIPLAA